MGFFLGKTWPFWLLAALLAALIAWLLCRWWSGRTGSVTGSGTSSVTGSVTESVTGSVTGAAADTAHQLSTTRTLLHSREAELGRAVAERDTHLAELEALRPKAAAHDRLTAQVDELAATSVPVVEHRARIDALTSQVTTLTGRIDELDAQAGQVPGLQARIVQLQGRAGQVDGLTARIHELEGRLAQRDAATPDVAAAAHLLGSPVALDDLTVVEGIGPKIAGLCNDAGIHTWRELSRTPVSRLQEILDAAGPRYQIHHPATWPKQAALLADGHWEPFKSWTDQLKGGRSED